VTVELRHFRYFVAVAEECHFGRAAERLFITQPSLSHQIRQLEQAVGAALLERTTRKVELTPAGKLFLERAQAVLAAAEDAVVDAARASRGEIGRLSIGFTGSATYDLLPSVVKIVRECLPHVSLELHGDLLTPAQVTGLLDGRLDVGFLRPPVRAPDINLQIVRREPLVAVLPETHPLAVSETISLSDLAADPFVSYPSQIRSVMHDAVEEACRRAGFRPQVALEVHEVATLLSFVAAGLGVGLVPLSAQRLRITGAVYRPLRERSEAVLAMAWRAGERSLVVDRFLRGVQSLTAQETPIVAVSGPA